jgi:hypothetical protein
MNFGHPSVLRRCAAIVSFSLAVPALSGQETQIRYLSGKGPKDAVAWDFQVTGGRRSGAWTTIPVPSNWELHGFGGYNYGQEANKSDEHGLYRLRFPAPAEWKGRRVWIVFEGAMTDTAVKINGQPAGPVHQGGFYRFRYDITRLLKFGETNLLEADVSKTSSNRDTEIAERGGDYWVFGGVYRPVYLEATPAQSIESAAIDARADGALRVDVRLGMVRDADRVEAQVLDASGAAVGQPFSTAIPGGGAGLVRLAGRVAGPRLWTAETPNLYKLRLTLRRGDETLHTIDRRFGFRTFEVRKDGLFLNGQRILLKGVCRHSFRPETGRALNPEDSYADVRLIKEMNMNAVRMSHYPPDVAFLEACDELGLYVLDELSGWQHAHDSYVGRLLVREMVERDVNHPSILFWDNGNEGGFNRDLDGEFAFYDPQNRPVLHPWEAFSGVDTKHYPPFDDLERRLRGPHLVMPTEVLHGIYDGGAGAGLEDYWNAISRSPFGAGAFLWVFADEGVVRTDQDGRIDVFSTFAPDGVVGPRHEKEGSFYTVRDVFAPVQVEKPVLDERFDGQIKIANRYDFTSLDRCRFSWKLLLYPTPDEGRTAPTVLGQGSAASPAVPPQATGFLRLGLPSNWRDADALALTVSGPGGKELWTSVWSAPGIVRREASESAARPAKPAVEKSAGEIRLRAGHTVAIFGAADGQLREVRTGNRTLPLSGGPRLTFARAATAGDIAWFDAPRLVRAGWSATPSAPDLTLPIEPRRMASHVEITADAPRSVAWIAYQLEISADGKEWKTVYEGTRRPNDNRVFEFAPQPVSAVRLSHLRRADGQAMTLKTVRVGYAAKRFPAAHAGVGRVAAGAGMDTRSGMKSAWVDTTGGAGLTRFRWTLLADGALRLDYEYAAEGDFAYCGVSFDFPVSRIRSFRWLGEGPYRAWKNRLRGGSLGVHEVQWKEGRPGQSWDYPESQGYFAALRWARIDTADGAFQVDAATADLALRVGAPRFSLLNTSPPFPPGALSFLHAIPAIGSKFVGPERTGPASQPTQLSGHSTGTLTFRFGL